MKYGIKWEEKSELKPTLPRVSIKKRGFNEIYVGDNLDALKVMITKNEKVNVIYIDPPYNTGKEFIYDDNKVDSDDDFRHSKWLSFMQDRLRLARDILTDDGVIFISIDDNELFNLKLLCDRIFGERNFIQNFVWNKTAGGPSLSKFSRTDFESILCYGKSKNKITNPFVGAISEGMGDSALMNKPNGYDMLTFPAGKVKFNKSSCQVEKNITQDSELHDDVLVKDHYNVNEFRMSAKWKWKQNKLDNEIKAGTVIISKNNKMRLRYIKDNQGAVIKPTKSITSKNGVDYNLSGSSELKKIIGTDEFSYPKPTSLIKYLIKMVTYFDSDAVVLDFFAGSGTTYQAVAELNNEDEGSRKVILCTNNENSIFDNITSKRIEFVNKKFDTSNTVLFLHPEENFDSVISSDFIEWITGNENFAIFDGANEFKIKESTKAIYTTEEFTDYIELSFGVETHSLVELARRFNKWEK